MTYNKQLFKPCFVRNYAIGECFEYSSREILSELFPFFEFNWNKDVLANGTDIIANEFREMPSLKIETMMWGNKSYCTKKRAKEIKKNLTNTDFGFILASFPYGYKYVQDIIQDIPSFFIYKQLVPCAIHDPTHLHERKFTDKMYRKLKNAIKVFLKAHGVLAQNNQNMPVVTNMLSDITYLKLNKILELKLIKPKLKKLKNLLKPLHKWLKHLKFKLKSRFEARGYQYGDRYSQYLVLFAYLVLLNVVML